MQTAPSPIGNTVLITRCLETMAHLIPVSASVFYQVNTKMQPENYILHGISDSIHQQYLDHFQKIDPLKPAHFQQKKITTVNMTPEMIADNSEYYQDFMLPNNMQDMTEIFIHQHKQIISGVCLIRDRPFTQLERSRLHAILPLLELATQDLLPEIATQVFTMKEQEVVSLVREGACNKRIASKLGISLSTVKTHMRNIFAKTAVNNRTELVSSGFIAHSSPNHSGL